jgi:nitrite reductase/ring-hydroxylating ferredoxin subunit
MSRQTDPTRRVVLQGAGVLSLGVLTVTSCSGPSTSGAGGSTAGAVATGPVGQSSAVPVGGGVIFPAAALVVTQPTAGDFKGFSTRCPHQGCAVASVTDGFIVCPCHNSRFAVATGEPTADSPARQPLTAVAVKVDNGEVVVG